ncbi:MAG: putative drug resistance protein, partial [Jatrophihabitantaceae bacterium]|nr:putative drug resistance protein [Jatrophihabitantaceae bacterium]
MTAASVAERRRQIARPEPTYPDYTHQQILKVLSGLLLSMFVAILSSTVVTNALPRITHELHGSESSYTWVITATLLTMTASTPIWGKLSDRVNRKLLMQLALGIFLFASCLAGFSQSMGMLIAARALQGIGSGGVMALAQIIIGAMIPPRERGRYSGYLGASFALATVLGPLIGGAIVDTPFLGWRGCFYAGVPFVMVAFVVLQRTLHLPHVKRDIPIDYSGALLIMSGVSTLLIWISLAGSGAFAWISLETALLVPIAAVLIIGAIFAETRATDPVIPLEIFASRTVLFSVLASVFMGVGMVGATVFMGQYFQIAKGNSAVIAGMLTLPLVGGMFLTSLLTGRWITATGKWKRYLVGGAVSLVAGTALLSTLSRTTPGLVISAGLLLVGIGIGATNQNLVLAVQNTLPLSQLGAGSSTVSFFRSLGSASGLAVLGAVLTTQLGGLMRDGFAAANLPIPPGGEHAIPNVQTMDPETVRIIQDSYATGIASVFLIMVPVIAIGAVLVLAIREVPLRNKDDEDDQASPAHDRPVDALAVDAAASSGELEPGAPRSHVSRRGP